MIQPSGLNGFMSKASAALAMRIAAAGSAFLLNVAVSRTMGAQEAGLFFLGQTCLVILAVLSRFGTDNVLLRYVSTFTEQQRHDAANAVLVKAGLVTLALASLLSAITFWQSDHVATLIFGKPEFASVLRPAALCVLPFSCFQVFSFAIQGRRQVATSIGINATAMPIFLLIAVLLPDTVGADTASELMWIAVMVATFNAAIAAIVWSRRADRSTDSDAISWPELNSMAIPLVAAAAVALIGTWAPQLVIASLESTDQIAMLSNSQKTATLVGLLLMAINSVAAPIYASMHAENQLDGLRQFAARVNGVMLLGATPVLFVVFIFAPQILSLFGSQFRDATWLLRILVLGQFVNAATGSVGYLLNMSGNQHHFRNAVTLSAIVSIVLSLALIPLLGTIGAAIAVSASLTVSNISSAYKVKQSLGINVLKPDFFFVTALLRSNAVSKG